MKGMENKRTEKRKGKKENIGKEQETKKLQERINHLPGKNCIQNEHLKILT